MDNKSLDLLVDLDDVGLEVDDDLVDMSKLCEDVTGRGISVNMEFPNHNLEETSA